MSISKKTSKAAAKFVADWQGHGYEKGETQKFWIDLLSNVFGVRDIASYVFFEEQVKEKIRQKTVTNFIDAYIPATRVMIEQKSSHKDLLEPVRQSDGTMLTPFQQAKKYVAELPLSQHPKWIVTCNFEEFHVYDMENPTGEPQRIFLKDLGKEYYRLQFLVNEKSDYIRREEEVSLQAGKLVGKLYDAFIKQYINPDAESLRSLNILCVRLVFCFYAEDAGLFETKTSFEDYIKSFPVEHLRKGVIELFKALDTKTEDRDPYDLKLKAFPYVNGGLFAEMGVEVPNFTPEIVDVMVNHCAPFNWSEISPTIFGAVFESTLNPETRRRGGMHYTSIENIHKVIDPLFMDDLRAEYAAIAGANHDLSLQKRNRKLMDFQKKIASLKFLDPACGSGNFLTETYMSLRRLENEIISVLNKGEKVIGFGDEFIKVSISQFYGIEINDFAVEVARTALWIAECQMAEETERLIGCEIDFLPLKNHANIVEGNALRTDWSTLAEFPQKRMLRTERLNVYQVDDFGDTVSAVEEPRVPYQGVYKELDVATKKVSFRQLDERERVEPVVYDYIIGNPPFVGYAFQSQGQKSDLQAVCPECGRNIDYVAGWYYKAAGVIKGAGTKAAFVSTNSITQGEQVAAVWKNLIQGKGIRIDFAYRTFRWDSESEQKAHVHCVIIGFSDGGSPQGEKFIFDESGNRSAAKNINPYLMDAPTIFVEKRKEPLSQSSPTMLHGSLGGDDGAFYFTEEEYAAIVKKHPGAMKFLREVANGQTYLHNEKRYCLWCANQNPIDLKKIPEFAQRVEKVKQFRLSSNRAATRKWAAYPYLFMENMQPESGNYLIVPLTSSERRMYVPIGYLPSTVIANNSVRIVPNATLYDFGILNSSVFMVWMRAVCGRLKSDYRITVTNVYNNFPWPDPTDKQKADIGQAAQGVLDARALYSDSCLADLYDDTFMPPKLRKAHEANDRAVMAAYGFDDKMTESEIVAELFRMYENILRQQDNKST